MKIFRLQPSAPGCVFWNTPDGNKRTGWEIKDYNAKRSGFDIFCGKLIDQVTPLGQDQETGITSYRSNLFRSGIDANTWTECANARNGFIRARQRVSSEYLFCNNNDGAGACKTF